MQRLSPMSAEGRKTCPGCHSEEVAAATDEESRMGLILRARFLVRRLTDSE